MDILAKIKSSNLIFVGMILGATTTNAPSNAVAINPLPEPETIIEAIPEKDSIDTLLEAMILVESRGKEDCIGDKHLGKPSIGVLQIRPIMVKEVNRILKKQGKKEKYTLDDRYSREKSVEMFYIWKEYYHSEDNDEVIARCWNGGPKGWKRKATLHYWNKVKKEINKIS
tara:strand:+ start:162 stop:671 length:510 start_codon:yes stop_codon:yes gene_type:complete